MLCVLSDNKVVLPIWAWGLQSMGSSQEYVGQGQDGQWSVRIQPRFCLGLSLTAVVLAEHDDTYYSPNPQETGS